MAFIVKKTSSKAFQALCLDLSDTLDALVIVQVCGDLGERVFFFHG